MKSYSDTFRLSLCRKEIVCVPLLISISLVRSLANNALTGKIPKSIASLSNLESLYVMFKMNKIVCARWLHP